MSEQSGSQPQAPRPRVNTPGGMFIRDLAKGTKVKLSNGAIVEVVENANDGGWLFGRYLEHEDEPDMVGSEDWIFFGDVSEELTGQ
jgi:hypothetical protein